MAAVALAARVGEPHEHGTVTTGDEVLDLPSHADPPGGDRIAGRTDLDVVEVRAVTGGEQQPPVRQPPRQRVPFRPRARHGNGHRDRSSASALGSGSGSGSGQVEHVCDGPAVRARKNTGDAAPSASSTTASGTRRPASAAYASSAAVMSGW